MLLAPVSEIREHLGFDDMVDINAATEACLSAVTPMLASRLGCPDFDFHSEREDVYHYEVEKGRVSTEFRLSNGFIRDIAYARSSERLSTLDGDASYDLLPTAIVRKEKGVFVFIEEERPYDVMRSTRSSAMFTKIKYSCGFMPDGTDPNLYDQGEVPDWLRQAAKVRALVMLAGSPVLEQAQIKLDVKALSFEYNAITQQKLRYTPLAVLAL